MLNKFATKDFGIHIGNNNVYPSTNTSNFGVIFITSVSFNDQVSLNMYQGI